MSATPRKRSIKKRIFFSAAALAAIALVASGAALLRRRHVAKALSAQFPVQGVDVSHYQGQIDWQALREQGITFAYIKATEGSGHADERFGQNWEAARQAGVVAGAYHFFSFDSPARTQAEQYISTVGPLEGRLVPAVDVEPYARDAVPPDKAQVRGQLRELLSLLEEHYGAKPFIYSTMSFYHTYLRNEFPGYPLWIRNVYFVPVLSPKDRWTLWQYTDRAVLDGYEGEERFIDRDAFRGTAEQLEAFIVRHAP